LEVCTREGDGEGFQFCYAQAISQGKHL
jgi:hypothetical protein